MPLLPRLRVTAPAGPITDFTIDSAATASNASAAGVHACAAHADAMAAVPACAARAIALAGTASGSANGLRFRASQGASLADAAESLAGHPVARRPVSTAGAGA